MAWKNGGTLRRAPTDRQSADAWEVRGALPVEQQRVTYRCRWGHDFTIPFAAGAETPDGWRCRPHGTDSPRAEPDPAVPPETRPARRRNQLQEPRTPWTMLTERRTLDDLDALLAERLADLRAARRRGEAAPTVTVWLGQMQGRRPSREPRGPSPDGRYLPF